MTNEQFEKLYQLLTGVTVGVCITVLLVFLICGIYFINTYYDDLDKKDIKSFNRREKEMRDKLYLSDLEHRLRNLEKFFNDKDD